MTEPIDLNSKRAPVVYTVTIVHHYDGTLEFNIENVGDDNRSRESVIHAFNRISGAADRIEQLETALRQLSETDLTGIARKALEGKDD